MPLGLIVTSVFVKRKPGPLLCTEILGNNTEFLSYIINTLFSWNDDHLSTKKRRQKSLKLGNVITRTNVKHLEKQGKKWAIQSQNGINFQKCRENVTQQISRLTNNAINSTSLESVQNVYKYYKNNLIINKKGIIF